VSRSTPCACLVALVLACPLAAGEEPGPGRQRDPRDFTGSPAFVELRRGGHEVVAERAWDLDGDGRTEAVVALEGADGLSLAVFKDAGEGDFREVFRSGASQASEVGRLEELGLGADRAIAFDVFEDNPDEAEHFVRLIAVAPPVAAQAPPRLALRTVFGGRYTRRHPEEEAGRAPVRLVDLGGLPTGLALGSAGVGRWPELRLRTDVLRVALAADPGGPPVWVVVGLREEVYRAEGGEYALQEERLLDFLPRAHPALAAGPAGAELALDDRVATGLALAPGQPAPSLALDLGAEREVRALRVLPGCAGSAEDWARRGRVGRLEVRFDGGGPLRLELGAGAPRDPRVLAQGPLGVPGAPFASQIMVVLAAPVRARRLVLTPEIGVAGEGGGACLGEIGLHLDAAGAPR